MEFYPSTVTPFTNSNINVVKKMELTSSHCIISLTFLYLKDKSNLDFALASGPIEARQLFKIQTRAPARPDNPD